MDFSKNAFQSLPSISSSNDTMDHAKMVMACRFSWVASPSGSSKTSLEIPQSAITPLISSSNQTSRRFAACHGNLYHQLECGHRIRTDLVEDCGSNCLEPLQHPAYFCHECVDQEAAQIWSQREAQHNSLYPPLESMMKEQYNQWYEEHRQLEAQYAADRKVYEAELKSKTRVSNRCMDLESSKDELDIATELDSLSLMVSQQGIAAQIRNSRPNRIPIPGDGDEQLHWALGQLDLERGSCAIEVPSQEHIITARRPIIVGKDERRP